ncbi:hypothetical protein [Cellulosimicrobium protaetiae]|uniref:hypothetical protein n=1 Tax=Cellulosimicrobium protaetiae TaxID=2587808 RepID=UPI0012B7DD88|nr:hypothetical protein [Cellulosimicrobium protaetiae]
MSRADWQEYVRWNDVVADVLFPENDAATPAYLDIEDHEIAKMGELLNMDADGVVDGLVEIVGRTIDHDSPDGFARHLERVRTWRDRSRTHTYPAVALLAVFSLAAERMAAEGGMASTNYYGRLADLLGGNKERLSRGYMHVAEPLWEGLNLWLSTLGGRRGTPTAFALGKRFVGLPLSQALVREADRRKLERFFVEFDFAPRSEVPGSELEPILGAWLADEQRRGSHLGKLWSKVDLRERIAGVASVELQSWNGVDESDDTSSGPRGRALIGLQFRGFPKRKLLIFPHFFVVEPGTARGATLRTIDGDQPISLIPSLDLQGSMSLDDPEQIDPAHLLEGVLQITEELGGQVVHPPRAVLVFRKDDLSGIWLETRQVLMGDDVVVLTADRTVEKVRGLLNEIARPGWTEGTTRPGLPTGWTLFEGVEIFGRPSTPPEKLNQDFHALVPLTSSQLKLSGGFALPGASRTRWHSAHPPEVRAMHDGGPFDVRLLDLDVESRDGGDQMLDSWPDRGTGFVLVDLATQELRDGHYALEMFDATQVLARKEFTLHSADDHDAAQWQRHDSVTHALGEPLAAIGAGTKEDSPCIVQGVVVAAEEEPEVEVGVPADRPWWVPAQDQVRRPSVALHRPDAKSCFFTGAHRLEITEVAYNDRSKTPVTGTCSYCGTTKRYSANYYRNRSAFERKLDAGSHTRRPIDVTGLPPVVSDSATKAEDWDIALDALRFLGGGPVSSLERVARQLDASSLFVADFISTLEALGHIEVRRSSETLQPEAWEVAPTAIIDAGGSRVLTGFWTKGLVAEVMRSCREHGHDVVERTYESGLTRYSTDATSDELADWLDVEDVLLAGRTGKTIAAFLPRLSEVVAALPRAPSPTMTELQWFDPARAAWVDVVGSSSPGAYRVGRYAARYFIRTEKDLESGTLAQTSAYMAKHHAASSLAGRPLLAYARHAKSLVVPLGALLPGMYERAVVLDSAAPPQKNRGMHVYRDVSEDVAARITYLLEN